MLSAARAGSVPVGNDMASREGNVWRENGSGVGSKRSPELAVRRRQGLLFLAAAGRISRKMVCYVAECSNRVAPYILSRPHCSQHAAQAACWEVGDCGTAGPTWRAVKLGCQHRPSWAEPSSNFLLPLDSELHRRAAGSMMGACWRYITDPLGVHRHPSKSKHLGIVSRGPPAAYDPGSPQARRRREWSALSSRLATSQSLREMALRTSCRLPRAAASFDRSIGLEQPARR